MILLISTCEHSLHEREFVLPIKNLVPNSMIVHHSKLTKAKLHKAKKIIICGTALKDESYLSTDWSWITTFDKPLLGICSGAQIITKTLGGKLKKAKEVGITRLTSEHPDWNNKEVFSLHRYACKPKNFSVIAKTSVAQLFSKENITCCLFHPEVYQEKWLKEWITNSS